MTWFGSVVVGVMTFVATMAIRSIFNLYKAEVEAEKAAAVEVAIHTTRKEYEGYKKKAELWDSEGMDAGVMFSELKRKVSQLERLASKNGETIFNLKAQIRIMEEEQNQQEEVDIIEEQPK